MKSYGCHIVLLTIALAPKSLCADAVDFAREIQPIFAQHCLECHGPDKQEGGFRFDEADSSTGEADSGQRPIVPGDVRSSELVVRITATDPDVRMPPEGDRLTPSQVQLLTTWIKQGATYNQHWAYRPLENPKLPPVKSVQQCRNEIDYFVLSRLESQNIAFSPAADRYTLIKRLYYDLLGLPPRVQDVDEFVSDESDSAYQNLVDRLLASPRFGERWGRHWLDKARFADSDGYEKDNSRPDAYLFRDWVIHAINLDLPFSQFTIEQLAGDLIPAANDSQHLATAFHRQTLTNTEGGTDKEQWRVAAVMDRTETLGTVWLGLTVGCARCHNHKYDQISQDEYYQLYAFFNNGDETTKELAVADGKKENVRVVSQRTDDLRVSHVLRRGDFLQPEHEVHPTTLSALPEFSSRRGEPNNSDRLDLAHWLVDGRNPLPPRVAVNHVWQQLFGAGLVRTVNDFGIRGESPTHPRLLDWLATEFIRHGWSRKWLIRTILLSATYRQSSRHLEELVQIDPANRLLHRQNRFRVEAEIIRDLALSASGLLSPRIGGPSVFPPIPQSVTDLTYNSGFKWETSQGADRYRRGMYTYFKRTAPHPNLITFDCPSSNVTNVQRERSNTPIGALVTLNNTVYVEAARAMGSRLLREFDDDEARLHHLLRGCVARKPNGEEVARLQSLLRLAKAYYQRHPDDATKLNGSDETDVSLAAWTATSRVAFNLDEFITRE